MDVVAAEFNSHHLTHILNCLIPWLSKSLPFLRRALRAGECKINGILPPAPNTIEDSNPQPDRTVIRPRILAQVGPATPTAGPPGPKKVQIHVKRDGGIQGLDNHVPEVPLTPIRAPYAGIAPQIPVNTAALVRYTNIFFIYFLLKHNNCMNDLLRHKKLIKKISQIINIFQTDHPRLSKFKIFQFFLGFLLVKVLSEVNSDDFI